MSPRQIAIVSGKGGTGKTTLVAAFAALADTPVIADCDVDAADLHLVLSPKTVHSEPFIAGKKATVRQPACTGCEMCQRVCRFGAVSMGPVSADDLRSVAAIDLFACEGCGVCAGVCPAAAIDFEPSIVGRWFLSETPYGPLVHARLDPAEENSGKLVTQVRSIAGKRAETGGHGMIIIDGPPGIGCPVIASVTGCDTVLIVAEPTVSGVHDMVRVAGLAEQFGIAAMLCVNKADVNPEMTDRLTAEATSRGVVVAGTIPYDNAMTDAQIAGQPVVQCCGTALREAIEQVWLSVVERYVIGRGTRHD